MIRHPRKSALHLYNVFHLLAAGVLPQWKFSNVCTASRTLSTDDAIDMLTERMAEFDEAAMEALHVFSPDDTPSSSLELSEIFEASTGCTPMEICINLRRDPFDGYNFRWDRMHPVLWAWRCETCSKVEGLG